MSAEHLTPIPVVKCRSSIPVAYGLLARSSYKCGIISMPVHMLIRVYSSIVL